jgi:hypothetical protein
VQLERQFRIHYPLPLFFSLANRTLAMPKTNNSRISSTEWEDHKETIQRLYLTEGKSLMGEGGVIELMKREGFSAR